jgi:hypothetical protein
MLRAKLFTYIASTLLANTLIVELLSPVYAKSVKLIESTNTVDKVTFNLSFSTDTDGILFQGNRGEIYSAQSNQSEVSPYLFTSNTWGLTTTTTITGIRQQSFIQDSEHRFIENQIEVLNGIELDLDSILATEFKQKSVLLARCCF